LFLSSVQNEFLRLLFTGGFMSERTSSYVIYPEVPQSYMGKLYQYIHQFYLVPQKERFADISLQDFSVTYTVMDASKKRVLKVQAFGDKAVTINIEPFMEAAPEAMVLSAKEDIDIAVDMFEAQVRKNSLFFAWREGETVLPEKSGGENKSLRRVFLETQILLISVFMALGIFLFLIIGPFVPIVLLAVQFVFVFYSNKIIARTADWHITEKNPYIHILQYPLSAGEDDPIKKIPKADMVKLKKQIYEETIAQNGELDCARAHGIFGQFGIECKPEDLISRKVNVYDIVKGTADKFGFKVPEIVISNTLLPNAAASGPSPSRGVVLITTGTFLQLSDEEIVSVLGHEFGHLKGYDPIWLYGLSAIQYLFWFYVVFGLLPTTSFFLLFIYLWILLTITYFIAKFFEARADLISAMVIGKPRVLADSLEKIGFQRLLFERVPSFRFQEWLSLDPHPPIYFRIARLRNLPENAKIKHPLIKSAKEVIRGFIGSF
jgi:heat shock protein HtpX